MIDFIQRTRDGVALEPQDIDALVDGVVRHRWPNYQIAAWLMAAYIRGLTAAEIVSLTKAMARSGSSAAVPLSQVDKHSTGGVGDKTTLVLAPLMASLGVTMAKMSGRGLGHTGGTLDKLESIPGFRVDLSVEEIRRQVAQVGVAVIAQSPQLAPADKVLYGLRDVTGTVESIGLIAASIMSKKLAAGAPNLVLDIKVGRGAFMNDTESAEVLARLMVYIGTQSGRRVEAILTAMDQPLGQAIGNAIEVNEALDCLKGQGPGDLRNEVVTLGASMAALAQNRDRTQCELAVEHAIDSGLAYEKMLAWVAAQGGNTRALERGLGLSEHTAMLISDQSRWVEHIDAREVGEVVLDLGAGRRRVDDRVNYGVGVRLLAKVGERVEKGQPLAEIWGLTPSAVEAARARLRRAMRLGVQTSSAPQVLRRISGNEVIEFATTDRIGSH